MSEETLEYMKGTWEKLGRASRVDDNMVDKMLDFIGKGTDRMVDANIPYDKIANFLMVLSDRFWEMHKEPDDEVYSCDLCDKGELERYYHHEECDTICCVDHISRSMSELKCPVCGTPGGKIWIKK